MVCWDSCSASWSWSRGLDEGSSLAKRRKLLAEMVVDGMRDLLRKGEEMVVVFREREDLMKHDEGVDEAALRAARRMECLGLS